MYEWRVCELCEMLALIVRVRWVVCSVCVCVCTRVQRKNKFAPRQSPTTTATKTATQQHNINIRAQRRSSTKFYEIHKYCARPADMLLLLLLLLPGVERLDERRLCTHVHTAHHHINMFI